MNPFSNLDRELFYLINHGWANPFFDRLFPWVTHLRNFVPVCVPLAIGLLLLGKTRGRLCVLALGATVAITDPLTVRVLQPVFDRTRPCEALADARLLVSRKTSPSFPSAHAVNSFGASAVFWRFFPRSAWGIVPVAVLVALSRVYVGVHYPSDVVAGALIGWGIGLGVSTAISVGARRLGARLARRRVPAAAGEGPVP